MRPASSESAISCSLGSAALQSSSASRNVLATADASAERVKSRETTTSWPSRPFFSEANFIVDQPLPLRLFLFAIEVLLQPLPAVNIVVLPRRQFGGVFRHPLAVAGLEHEGERVGKLHRLQVGLACVLKRLAVGTVRQHLVVQAHAARHEAFGLSVIDAVNQAHELRHDV